MTDELNKMVNRSFTPYNDEYPTCERTVAKLRVYLGQISPSHATDLLGINPTSTSEAGRVVSSKRTGFTRTEKLNAWFLSSEDFVDSKDSRRHLDWLLDTIAPASEALKILREESGVKAYVTCIWWSAFGDGGPTMSPAQMAKLCALNIECQFEFAYFGPEEE
jgi:hypothetical protein